MHVGKTTLGASSHDVTCHTADQRHMRRIEALNVSRTLTTSIALELNTTMLPFVVVVSSPHQSPRCGV